MSFARPSTQPQPGGASQANSPVAGQPAGAPQPLMAVPHPQQVHAPPPQVPPRLVELLDGIKAEFASMSVEASRLILNKNETDTKIIHQHMSELRQVRKIIYELDQAHRQMRERYEAEISRLRHSLDAVQQQQPPLIARIEQMDEPSSQSLPVPAAGPQPPQQQPPQQPQQQQQQQQQPQHQHQHQQQQQQQQQQPQQHQQQQQQQQQQQHQQHQYQQHQYQHQHQHQQQHEHPSQNSPAAPVQHHQPLTAQQAQAQNNAQQASVGGRVPQTEDVKPVVSPAATSEREQAAPAFSNGAAGHGAGLGGGSVASTETGASASPNGALESAAGSAAAEAPAAAAAAAAGSAGGRCCCCGGSGSGSGSSLASLDADQLPPEFVREADGYKVVYNPAQPRVLDVELVRSLQHSSVVCCVRFSNDGKLLATGCNRSAQIYDVQSGELLYRLQDPNVDDTIDLYIRSVCFSPDGKLLATGAEDHKVRVWDIEKRKIRHVFSGHDQDIYSLVYSSNGRFVVSGSGDRKVKMWDVETAACHREFLIEDGVTAVALSPDDRFVAAGSLDKSVRVWDVEANVLVEKLDGADGHEDSVYSVSYRPQGRELVSGSLDKTLKVWELSPPGHANEGRVRKTIRGHSDYVLSVAVTPDSRWILSGSKDRTVQMWDTDTGDVQLMVQAHVNSVISVAQAPEGQLFASGGGDFSAKIWRYTEKRPA